MAKQFGWWDGDPIESDYKSGGASAAGWWEDDPFDAPPAKAAPQADAYVEDGMPAIMTPVPMGQQRQAAPMPEPAPFVPQDQSTTAGAMGRQFARGAIETVALAPKGAAALGYQVEGNVRGFGDRQLEVMNRIDRGEAVPDQDDAAGYQYMNPAQRARVRAEAEAVVRANQANPQTPIEQRGTYQAGEAIDEFGRTRFPTTRAEDEAFWTGQIPRALGSTAAMAPVALAGAPLGAVGRLLAAAGIATTGSGEATQTAVDRRRTLEDMVRSGDAPSPEAYPSDRQIATAAGQGLAPGALDAAAIDNLLRPVLRGPGWRGVVTAIAKKAIEQGVVEGTTEGVQQVLQNLITRFGYDPDQGVLEQVAENVLVGGVVGILTGGLAGGVAPRRAAPQVQPVQQQGTAPVVSQETVGQTDLGMPTSTPGLAGAGAERVEVPQAAPTAAPAASPAPVPVNPPLNPAEATGQTGTSPDIVPSVPPVTPAPSGPVPGTPEDFADVMADPRPVAEIMAERQAKAEREATIAAVTAEDGPEAAAAVVKVLDGQGTRTAPVQVETAQDVDAAAALAAQPTPAQAEAGNYRHGHVRIAGIDISIETPRGGTRTGIGADGRPWSNADYPAHYGYFKRSSDTGDGKVDVFVGDEPASRLVYVIDQIDPKTGKFDEPKVMVGFEGEGLAAEVYQSSYSDGFGAARMGAITPMTVPELQAWLKGGDPTKPLAYAPPPPVRTISIDEIAPQIPVAPAPVSADPPPGTQVAAPRPTPGPPVPVSAPVARTVDTPDQIANQFAASAGVTLTPAERRAVVALLAEGVDPELAVEEVLTRSGIEVVIEAVEAEDGDGSRGAAEGRSADERGARGPVQVAAGEGPAARDVQPSAAPKDEARGSQPAGDRPAEGEEAAAAVEAQAQPEPAKVDAPRQRAMSAKAKREEAERKKRDAAITRREAAKKAIQTRRANAGALNIVQRIASAGGIKDPGGDLQAIMGRPNLMVPVYGALRNDKTGTDPDRMREMLVEEKFLPEGATLNDLYEAIDATTRGRPVYSQATAAEIEARVDETERKAEKYGDGPRFQRPRTEKIDVAKGSLSDEQMVIPGAERVAAEGKKAAKAPQRSVAETPLFGGEQAATGEVRKADAAKEKGRQGALFQTPRQGRDIRAEMRESMSVGPQSPAAAVENAERFLRARFERTGHEAVTLTSLGDGRIVGAFTSDSVSGVEPDSAAARFIVNPNLRLVVQHTHPDPVALSPEDIATLAFPGIHWMVAHVPGGGISAARLTDEARQIVRRSAWADAHRDLHGAITRTADEAIRLAEQSGTLTSDDTNDSVDALVGRAAHAAGLIEYTDSMGDAAKLFVDAGITVDRIATLLRENLKGTVFRGLQAVSDRAEPAEVVGVAGGVAEILGLAGDRGRPGGVADRDAEEPRKDDDRVEGKGRREGPARERRGEVGTAGASAPVSRSSTPDRARFRVAGEIDATVNLSPEDKRRRDAVLRAITVTLTRMAGKARPQAAAFDLMQVQGQDIWGVYSPADNMIAVSMRSPDPIGTVRHETIHVMRGSGLIDDAAWSALSQAAERDGWLAKHQITERWGEDLTREQAIEEAIAEEFGVGLREGVWKTGNAKVDAIFQRIAEFLRRVRAEVKRALAAAGMRDTSDADVAEYVFSLIERGAFRSDAAVTEAPQEAFAQTANDQDGALYQMAQAGAQQAAARPESQRRSFLSRAIAALKGGDLVDPRAKVQEPHDIGLARKIIVTPRTIGAYFPEFARVFRAGVRQFRTRDMMISDFTEIARGYLDLPQESKEKINKVLEHGRMAGETYAPAADGTIKVKNKVGQQIRGKIGGVTLMKDGEEVVLTPDEARAYRAYRATMDAALDRFRSQVLREWGYDPADAETPKDAQAVEEIAKDTENAGERARLKTLASILLNIQRAKKTGYVPFTRHGSHFVTVTSLQDGRSHVVHREHIEPGLTTNPKAPWILKKATIPRLEQEAAALRKRLAEIYPPDQGFQISELQEVTPDSIGDMPSFSDLDAIIAAANLPPEQSAKVMEAVGEAIKKRGFRAHFIKSRNIPGYSTDLERSLADYIVGISGYLARREHMPEIEEAIAGIPAREPKLREYAKAWNEYIQNPSEELQTLRQVGFFMYLGWRISSAIVNLSQIPVVTMPWLSTFSNPVAANAQLARAYKDVLAALRPLPKSKGGAGLDVFDVEKLAPDVRPVVRAALKDGRLLPIETFDVMAKARGRTPGARSFDAKVQYARESAAYAFQAAERMNRLVTFIAAYRLAQNPEVMRKVNETLRKDGQWTEFRKERQRSAEDFATFSVEETQFVQGKVNRSTVMRGPGTAIFQFKSFTINYLELLARLGFFGSGTYRGGTRFATMAGLMGMLVLTSGLMGLPGADDGLEILEAITKYFTGIDPQFERRIREAGGSVAAAIVAALGADEDTQEAARGAGGRMLARGPLRETGIDISQRIGQGRVAPQPTGGQFDPFWERAFGLLGIPASLALRVPATIAHLWKGEWIAAGISGSPEFIADQFRAYELANEGVKTRARGQLVMRPDDVLPDGTTVGGGRNVTKRIFGFQPTGISRAREQMRAVQRAGVAANDIRAEWNISRAKLAARAEKAKERGDVPAQRLAERDLAALVKKIERHNESASPENRYDFKSPGYQTQLRTEMQGQMQQSDRKAPKRVRGELGTIRSLY